MEKPRERLKTALAAALDSLVPRENALTAFVDALSPASAGAPQLVCYGEGALTLRKKGWRFRINEHATLQEFTSRLTPALGLKEPPVVIVNGATVHKTSALLDVLTPSNEVLLKSDKVVAEMRITALFFLFEQERQSHVELREKNKLHVCQACNHHAGIFKKGYDVCVPRHVRYLCEHCHMLLHYSESQPLYKEFNYTRKGDLDPAPPEYK